LIDIGFFIGFSWIWKWLFSRDLDIMINVCYINQLLTQRYSGAELQARAVMLYFAIMVFTIVIVFKLSK